MGDTMNVGMVFTALNIVLAYLLAPLLNGLERKIRARIQNRLGPSILQTFYDLAKLWQKPSLYTGRAQLLLLSAALVQLSIALSMIPTVFGTSISFVGDLIVLLYLITSSTVFLALAAASAGSVYTQLGCSREISVVMANELALAFIVTIIAIDRGGFALSKVLPSIDISALRPSILIAIALLLLVVYMESSRLPFELAEAEPEIVSGIMAEFSGRELALACLCLYLKRLLLMTLLIDLIIPRPLSLATIPSVASICIDATVYLGLLTLLTILFVVIESIFGRFTLEKALRFSKRIALVAFVTAALSMVGW